MKLGEAMYNAQQSQSAGAEGPSTGESADDGVVDAEFEEVDDNNNSSRSA